MSEEIIRVVCTDSSHETRKHIVSSWSFTEGSFGPVKPASRSSKRSPNAGVVNLLADQPVLANATPFHQEYGRDEWRSKVDLRCRLCGLRLQLRDYSRFEELLDKARRAGLAEVELKHLIAILT